MMRLQLLALLVSFAIITELVHSFAPMVGRVHKFADMGKIQTVNRRTFAPFSPASLTLSSTATDASAADNTPKPSIEKTDETTGLKRTLKVGFLFGLWYALNIGYNISNKKVLNMAPQLTYTVAFMQLFLGLLYVIPVWGLGLRKKPELTVDEAKTLWPVVACHLLTHLGAVVSLGAGAVSFTHIVKAAEPAVSAGLSAIFLKSIMPLPVYLSLIPVMGGVALASLTELSFTWLGFIGAMVSNVASASRGIVGKKSMGAVGKNMTAENTYAVMTILSSLLCLPVAIFLEGGNIGPAIEAITAAGNRKAFAVQTFLSAIFYYLYNEVAFLTLDNVNPVTHALGNTIKRVVIIIASVIVFGTKMTTQGVIGSATAIFGVLLYSLAKNKFK